MSRAAGCGRPWHALRPRPPTEHFARIDWADLRGNRNMNPAPDCSIDFRHGGHRKPQEGRTIVQDAHEQNPAPETKSKARFVGAWYLLAAADKKQTHETQIVDPVRSSRLRSKPPPLCWRGSCPPDPLGWSPRRVWGSRADNIFRSHFGSSVCHC